MSKLDEAIARHISSDPESKYTASGARAWCRRCYEKWPCTVEQLCADNARLKASNVWLRKGIVGIREYAIRENLAVPYQITRTALAEPSAEGGQA